MQTINKKNKVNLCHLPNFLDLPMHMNICCWHSELSLRWWLDAAFHGLPSFGGRFWMHFSMPMMLNKDWMTLYIIEIYFSM